ncbi:hypothetical protein BCR42DRAFT_400699, partial [Absidia repens]
ISLHWLCFTWSTIKIKGYSSIYSIIHYFIPSSRTLPITHYHLQSFIIIEIYYYNIRFSSFYYKNPLSFLFNKKPYQLYHLFTLVFIYKHFTFLLQAFWFVKPTDFGFGSNKPDFFGRYFFGGVVV